MIGRCKGCDTEPLELVDGMCAECWQRVRGVGVSFQPIIDDVVETVRAHPVGARVIESLEDWAAGRRARKAREGKGTGS